jgi:hypothetical protein
MLAQLHEQGSVARARSRGRSDFAWSTTVFRSPRSRRNIAALSRADADRVEEMCIRPPRTQAAGLGRERVQWWAQGRADVVAVRRSSGRRGCLCRSGVAAVVKGAAVSAVVDVPAQRRGAAVLDGTEYLVHVQRMGVLVQGVGQMRAQDVGDFERRSLLGAGVRVSRSVMGSWRGKEWRCHCVCLFFFLLIVYFSAGAALSRVWSLPTR